MALSMAILPMNWQEYVEALDRAMGDPSIPMPAPQDCIPPGINHPMFRAWFKEMDRKGSKKMSLWEWIIARFPTAGE